MLLGEQAVACRPVSGRIRDGANDATLLGTIAFVSRRVQWLHTAIVNLERLDRLTF